MLTENVITWKIFTNIPNCEKSEYEDLVTCVKGEKTVGQFTCEKTHEGFWIISRFCRDFQLIIMDEKSKDVFLQGLKDSIDLYIAYENKFGKNDSFN